MMMKRRDFIAKGSLAGVGAVAASTLSAPAIAADRIEIAMVSTWPRDFPGLGTGAKARKIAWPGRYHSDFNTVSCNRWRRQC